MLRKIAWACVIWGIVLIAVLMVIWDALSSISGSAPDASENVSPDEVLPGCIVLVSDALAPPLQISPN